MLNTSLRGVTGHGIQAEQKHLKHSAAKLESHWSRTDCKAPMAHAVSTAILHRCPFWGMSSLCTLATKSSHVTGELSQSSALLSGYHCVGLIRSFIFLVHVSIGRNKNIFWVTWKILFGFNSSEVAHTMCLTHPLVGILRRYWTFHLQYYTWGKETLFYHKFQSCFKNEKEIFERISSVKNIFPTYSCM